MGLPADLRYSARSFARTPGVTAALVLTIALGIGSNASVYGFVRGLIVRETPLTAVDRFVSLYGRDSRAEASPLSYSDYLSLENDRPSFEWLGLARELQGTVARGDRSAIMAVAAVSADLAAFLNLSFDDGVVISHRLWVTEFQRAATIRGEEIRIDESDVRVASVAPEWFEGLYAGRNIDIWIPLREESAPGVDRQSRSWWVFGRLRQDVSAEDARKLINASRIGTEIGVIRYTGMTPEMTDGLARVGTLLSLAAGAVFFIACANVAAFLMGRASARAHETSLRVALGVSRRQLLKQLLSDSVLVSMTGCVFGILLASWTVNVVPALLFVEDAGRLVFAPDWFSIASAAATCGAITVACGLMPLLEVRHDRPAAILQRESLGPSKGMRRFRAGLVVAQMTCCCILVISASLLVHGLRGALQSGVAHRLGQPILATVQTSPEIDLKYFEAVEQAALSVPGVFETAWTARLPGNRPVWQSLRIEPAGVPLREVTLDIAAFTADMLPEITLPPIAGRMFGFRDTPDGCRVAVVSKEAARQLGGNPVGRSIVDVSGQIVEIIGVVATRKKDQAVANRPTIFYYGNQQSVAPGGIGPAPFRGPASLETKNAVLDAQIVSPGYFDAMGLSTVAGEIFSGNRVQRSCRVAVVNKEAAEQYFGGNAVGAAVIDGLGRRIEIIGVVDAELLRTFQRRAEPAIYFPMADEVVARMTLILGAREASDAMVSVVRASVEPIPGAWMPPVVRSLEVHLAQTALAPLRIATVLVGVFAAIALALGILGLYGALSDAARQRRREMAVRILLGAQGWRVIRQVVVEGGRLAGAGTVTGMLASVVAARLLTRVAPTGASPSVWVWMSAPLLLLGAVAIASVIPAYRALSVDPLTITRDDK